MPTDSEIRVSPHTYVLFKGGDGKSICTASRLQQLVLTPSVRRSSRKAICLTMTPIAFRCPPPLPRHHARSHVRNRAGPCTPVAKRLCSHTSPCKLSVYPGALEIIGRRAPRSPYTSGVSIRGYRVPVSTSTIQNVRAAEELFNSSVQGFLTQAWFVHAGMSLGTLRLWRHALLGTSCNEYQ